MDVAIHAPNRMPALGAALFLSEPTETEGMKLSHPFFRFMQHGQSTAEVFWSALQSSSETDNDPLADAA